MSTTTVSLGEVADFVNGVAFKEEDWGEEGRPIIRIQNLNDHSKPFNRTKRDVPDRNLARRGDLLVSWAASLGVYEWSGEEACINQHIFKVLPKAGLVDQRYLMHALEASIDSMESQMHGATMKHITRDKFLGINIPLPPPDEQRRIAAILDKADALRAKRREAIAKLDQLLQSTFLDMFGDPVTNPNGWPTPTVGSCCEKVTVGIVVRPASYYVEAGVPAIRSLNIGVNRIIGDDFVYFSERDNNGPLKKTVLRRGDVVAVRSGQPGKAAVVPPELDGANAIDVLIARTDDSLLLPEFLGYFLNSAAGKKLVLKEQRGQVQKHLNVKQLSEAEIPLPPLDEQKRFLAFARNVGDLEKRLMTGSTKFEALFTGIQSRAFAGTL